MSAAILDGKALAEKIRVSLAPRIQAFAKAAGRPPRLAILGAPGPASESYLKAKLSASRAWGLEVSVHALPTTAGQPQALKALRALAREPRVDGVALDIPLPRGLNPNQLLAKLPPEKDAEGLCPSHYGRLFLCKSYAEIQAQGIPVPCTAAAVIELLRETRTPLAGKHAVVVGRSSILGRPAAHLLACLDLTVTLCHSRTRDLEAHIRRADIVAACLGRARFIKGSWLKKDCVAIDAGINQDQDGLCGDMDFAGAREVASYITPVPGGVGPVTTAMLLANTLRLAETRRGSPLPPGAGCPTLNGPRA